MKELPAEVRVAICHDSQGVCEDGAETQKELM